MGMVQGRPWQRGVPGGLAPGAGKVGHWGGRAGSQDRPPELSGSQLSKAEVDLTWAVILLVPEAVPGVLR